MSMRKYFRVSYGRLGASGTNTLDIDVGPPGKLRVITHITIQDKTNNVTVTKAGPYNGAEFFQFYYVASLSANVLGVYNWYMLLFPGELLRVSIASVTASDLLNVVVEGYWDDEITDPGGVQRIEVK
jgi:hypothetical protein